MTETDTTLRVLFLCTQNAARSQMAEAFLRHYAGDRFEVLSAGLAPTEVHPLTRQVLTETGLDPRGLRAKGLNDVLGKVRIHYEGSGQSRVHAVLGMNTILPGTLSVAMALRPGQSGWCSGGQPKWRYPGISMTVSGGRSDNLPPAVV